MSIPKYIDAIRKFKTMYHVVVHASLAMKLLDKSSIRDYFYCTEADSLITNYPKTIYSYCLDEDIVETLSLSYEIVKVPDGKRVVLTLRGLFNRRYVSDPWLDVSRHNIKHMHPIIPYKVWTMIINK